MFERMTIKEIAEICHCSTRTLRYYEEIGLIKPSRMENNYRIYGFDAVSRVEVIMMLKKTGMQLDKIKKELSKYRKSEEILAIQRQLLEKERERINKTLAFIDDQQRMYTLYQKHGLGNLFIDDCCIDYETVRKVEKEEIIVLMEYDEFHLAIENHSNPDVYLVKKNANGVSKRIAAVFMSGEHRIRHRQKLFTELIKNHGQICQSLIYSESYCLMDDGDVYFMWCEVTA